MRAQAFYAGARKLVETDTSFGWQTPLKLHHELKTHVEILRKENNASRSDLKQSFYTGRDKMASTSLPVDISILEDQVIEVSEMEDAMEECMMFVKKLSETSLTEMEKEKNKLQELLQKAEREMKNMKQALKRSCSKRDEWRDKCLLERDGKTHADRQLKDAKQRIQKMEALLEEQKTSLKNLQQQKIRSAETVKDLKDKITAQKNAKQQLDDELAEVKTTLQKAIAENDELQKRLFDESQKSMHRANAEEEQLAALKTQLVNEKAKFETFEEESAERTRHLEENLAKQQAINKRLSDEAEAHMSELEGKVSIAEGTVTRLEKRNEELRANLSNAQKDSEQFEGRLKRVRSENDLMVNQKDKRIHELVEELKETKERLREAEARAEKESARNDPKVSGCLHFMTASLTHVFNEPDTQGRSQPDNFIIIIHFFRN